MRVKTKIKRYSKMNSMLMFLQMTVNLTVKIQTLVVVFSPHQGLQFNLWHINETCTEADFNQNSQLQRLCPINNSSSLKNNLPQCITYICIIQPIPGVILCWNVVIYRFGVLWMVSNNPQKDFQQLSREWVWTCCSQSMVGTWTYKYSEAIQLVCEHWGVSVVTANRR